MKSLCSACSHGCTPLVGECGACRDLREMEAQRPPSKLVPTSSTWKDAKPGDIVNAKAFDGAKYAGDDGSDDGLRLVNVDADGQRKAFCRFRRLTSELWVRTG